MKKEKIGAGYLTTSGALFLIADDFNVDLDTVPQKPKHPIMEFDIEVISNDDLIKKNRALSSDENTKTLHSLLTTPLLIIGLFGASLIYSNYDDLPNLYFYLGIVLIVGATIGLIFRLKIPGRNLKRKEAIFHDFFKCLSKTE